MKPLTKDQAMKISLLHFKYLEEHPTATKEELKNALYNIKRKVLKSNS